MAILKIVRMGHPVLSRPAEPVADPASPQIRRLATDMIETMLDAPGVGLAAPQVHAGLRMFVYHVPQPRGRTVVPPTVLINPVLSPLSDEMEIGWEKCLSLPALRGMVPRHRHLRYDAIGLDGEILTGEAEGFHARVLQHEQDHLDGVLFLSRMRDFGSFGFEDELDRAALQEMIE